MVLTQSVVAQPVGGTKTMGLQKKKAYHAKLILTAPHPHI